MQSTFPFSRISDDFGLPFVKLVPDATDDVSPDPGCPFFLHTFATVGHFDRFVASSAALAAFNLAVHAVVLSDNLGDGLAAAETVFSSNNPFYARAPDLVLFLPLSNGSSHTFAAVKRGPEGGAVFLDLWKDGAFVRGAPMFTGQPRDLGGKLVSAATFVLPPFTIQTDEPGRFVGMEVTLILLVFFYQRF